MAGSGTKLHGKNGAIYLGGPKGSGTKVTTKTEWTLNMSKDYVDATTFGDTNKTWLTGLPNFQGTYAGLLDVSGDTILTDSFGLSPAQLIYLYADDGTSPVLVAHGSGFLDSTVTTSNTDAVRITGEFRAAANWSLDM